MKLVSMSLAATILIGAAASAQAGALVPSTTVNIKFTGFCDGMRLVINEDSGLVTGYRTGCASGNFVGTVGSNSKLGAGITIVTDYYMYVIDDSPQSFTVYRSYGAIINSGSYAIGNPVSTTGRATSRSTSP